MNKKNKAFIILPILLFILFIILAICVKLNLTLNFDNLVYGEVVKIMCTKVTSIMKVVTHIGDPISVFLICVALLLIPKSRKTIAIPVSVTVIMAAIANTILKNSFLRERPNILRLVNVSSYSFPSGHAMGNSALYTILILLTFKYIKSKPKKIILSIAFILITMTIGISRVYLGVHYATDILGGWLLGVGIGIIGYLLWIKEKFIYKYNSKKIKQK